MATIPTKSTVVEEFSLTSVPKTARASRASLRGRPAPSVTYRVIRTTQADPYDRKLTPVSARATALLMAAKGDSFQGTKRKATKISIAKGAVEVFKDVKALIKTLATETSMKNHAPPVTQGAASQRVAEEMRNVRLKAWIFAASRESDNDFHLIVGNNPKTKKGAPYITMEVSGLPPASSKARKKLEKVRNAYKAFFDELPGSGYDFYDPPVPVEIGGSLCFDISHVSGGRPGPKDLRPKIPTVWEIHPVTSIKFEP